MYLSYGLCDVLQICFNLTLCVGSCTACVVALHREESAIYTANLGDSGFRVIRAGKIVHRSQEQQHYFNTPFQLAVAPSDMQGLVLSDRSAMQLLFIKLTMKK